ncbi:MAG: hypothetical protein K6G16_09630 [Lachnospiraceae bacterium]|nr:hypothetical protein [Lachnospiraceae bacterium]
MAFLYLRTGADPGVTDISTVPQTEVPADASAGGQQTAETTGSAGDAETVMPREETGEDPASLPTDALTQAGWQKRINEAVPAIDCWGDSITEGYLGDGESFPQTLAALIDEELIEPIRKTSGFSGLKAPIVRNMGVSTETVPEIAGRRGAIPFVMSEDIVIPADTAAVECPFVSSDRGQTTKPLRKGDGKYGGNGINPVRIAGVEGELIRYYDVEADFSRYRFARSVPGKEMPVPAGEAVITDAAGKYADDLCVVLMGANGGYEDTANLVGQFAAMAGMQREERFLLIGMGHRPENNGLLSAEEKQALAGAFGDRFLSLQDWMAAYGIDCANHEFAAGIVPTAEDERRVRAGVTPSSLLNEDDLHYTPTGYRVIGYMVFAEMDSRGYFDGLKALAGGS